MNENFVGTTQEFADMVGVAYLTASGLLRFLKETGKAEEVDKRPAKGGRGKPSTVYSVPMVVTLRFHKYADEMKEAA